MGGNAVEQRKTEHLQIAQQQHVEFGTPGFERFRLPHKALPEIDYAEIDTSTVFLGKKIAAPYLISGMTGGIPIAEKINKNLAAAAQKKNIAMGVGSQRKAILDPSLSYTYQVRSVAPSIPLLANMGVVQFNYGFGVKEAQIAVEMIDADALALHMNPLQEAIQPEGDRNFKGLLKKIERLSSKLPVPLIAKEIGNGISEEVALQLVKSGVRIVDTAGSGGTSWATIEARRAQRIELGETFAIWGIPTAESIIQCKKVPHLTIIGSGGIRDGIMAAKALILGADMVGIALPFLKHAAISSEQVESYLDLLMTELRIVMFCCGVKTIKELKKIKLEESA